MSVSNAAATSRENLHLHVSSESLGSQVTMGCKENISGMSYTFLSQGFNEASLHYIQPR